jgi:dephospho-CoA kinase
MKILIIGNVGSGKSTFLKLLKQYVNSDLYDFVDADLIAKQIIKEKNIILPENRTQVFEDINLLYRIENDILPFLASYFPQNGKNLIMEASTLIECPLILDNEDIIIHVSSKNSVAQTFARDKVENRANLIAKVQVTPWVKSLISDIEVTNDSTLEALEEKAKNIAFNLNHQKTRAFNSEIDELNTIWFKQFGELSWISTILKEYTSPERTTYNHNYLLKKFKTLNSTTIEVSELWKNALYMAIWFSKFHDNNDEANESNIKELWSLAKQSNSLPKLTYGSRSYISLACELLYSLKSEDIFSPNLNHGEGMIAHNLLYKVINNI